MINEALSFSSSLPIQLDIFPRTDFVFLSRRFPWVIAEPTVVVLPDIFITFLCVCLPPPPLFRHKTGMSSS